MTEGMPAGHAPRRLFLLKSAQVACPCLDADEGVAPEDADLAAGP
jgi:hypothetical protein